MGFAEKPLQMEGGGGEVYVDSEVKKWVIAGVPLRSPLKPIFTRAPHQKKIEEIEEENSCSTPTSEESRIPSRLACPPPPRKKPKPEPKPSSGSSSCEYYMGNSSSGVISEFFIPPHDFEILFTRRAVEGAG